MKKYIITLGIVLVLIFLFLGLSENLKGFSSDVKPLFYLCSFFGVALPIAGIVKKLQERNLL